MSSYGVEKSLRELAVFADEVEKAEEKTRLRDDPNFKNLVWNRDMYGHEGAKTNREILRRDFKAAKKEKSRKYIGTGAGIGAALGAASWGALTHRPSSAAIGAGVGGAIGAAYGSSVNNNRAAYVARLKSQNDPNYTVKKSLAELGEVAKEEKKKMNPVLAYGGAAYGGSVAGQGAAYLAPSTRRVERVARKRLVRAVVQSEHPFDFKARAGRDAWMSTPGVKRVANVKRASAAGGAAAAVAGVHALRNKKSDSVSDSVAKGLPSAIRPMAGKVPPMFRQAALKDPAVRSRMMANINGRNGKISAGQTDRFNSRSAFGAPKQPEA
jgi:hypothetical protein